MTWVCVSQELNCSNSLCIPSIGCVGKVLEVYILFLTQDTALSCPASDRIGSILALPRMTLRMIYYSAT